jgi:biotin operon repressor
LDKFETLNSEWEGDGLTFHESEAGYEASATQEKVRWYQTILKMVMGYNNVPINGNHNDPESRNALRTFAKEHGFERQDGYLGVDASVALTQIALQRIYRKAIPNSLGNSNTALENQIKQLQRDYGLKIDGKVGQGTRAVMVRVLNQNLPPPFPLYHPYLGPGRLVPRTNNAEIRTPSGPYGMGGDTAI